MLRFRDGDGSAFEQLVQRNTGRVHALVYRFLGGPNQAEDIAQEVFLRVARTAARYEPTAKFSTWLYRIVANLCLNALRKQRKGFARQMESRNDEGGEAFLRSLPAQTGPGPGARLEQEELSQRVARAVNALPEAQKLGIILNKFEDKSYDEIAEILSCTTMAVKSLLRRARQNLKLSLEGCLDRDEDISSD